jgi:drug/metabolite transporter (DMT)-like permease
LFLIRTRGGTRGFLSDGFQAGLRAGPFLGVASTFYILALTHTTVANAMMTFTATPLLVAAIAWLTMREPLRIQTAIAMIFAVVGIGIMSIDNVAGGTSIGSLFAICNVIASAGSYVMLRHGSRKGEIDILAAMLVAASIAGAGGWIGSDDLQISLHDKLICFFWGFGLQTLGTALVATAARFIVAAELSLIVLLEAICGPIWVWFLFAEQPRIGTIVGGLVTVLTMGAWFSLRIRSEYFRKTY